MYNTSNIILIIVELRLPVTLIVEFEYHYYFVKLSGYLIYLTIIIVRTFSVMIG